MPDGTNVAEEIRSLLEDEERTLLAAEISLCRNYTSVLEVTLYPGEDSEAFLKSLEQYNYDAGYGTQELFGTLWFSDGNWAEREEYDGSEHWNVLTRPAIPRRE